MNKVILIGRITKDHEIKQTPSGDAVLNFSLAVNRSYSDQNGEQQTDFFNIVCWRKVAENTAQYTGKGSQVAVEGELQTRKYQAQDGTERVVTEIKASTIEFLSSPQQSGVQQQMPQQMQQQRNKVGSIPRSMQQQQQFKQQQQTPEQQAYLQQVMAKQQQFKQQQMQQQQQQFESFDLNDDDLPF